MSARWAIGAIVASCVVVSGPVWGQPGMAPAEQLLIPFSPEEWKSWKIGSQGKRPGFTMIEYVPQGQTVQNWDRMLTVQIFHNPKFGLAQLMGGMKATFEGKQPCEQTHLQAIGTKKMNGYDTSMHRLVCTRSKQTGKGEVALMLGIQGRDAVYLVQRAWRGPAYTPKALPPSKAELQSWVDFMAKVQVCDPRVPGQTCPEGLKRQR
jgi:hypothetical protein